MQSVRNAQPPAPLTDGGAEAAIEGPTVALARFGRGAAAPRPVPDLSPAEAFGELGTVAIPVTMNAPGAARIVVAHCLRGLVTRRTVEDAELLVSELVTNSLVHGGLDSSDAVVVRVSLAARAIRVEVENSGTAGTLAAHEPDPQAGQGFGLEIMERLTTHWGVQRDRTTRVWFEVERA
jgi:anti-sigma regulatory factor (Ser/Thr protein kinase)